MTNTVPSFSKNPPLNQQKIPTYNSETVPLCGMESIF